MLRNCLIVVVGAITLLAVAAWMSGQAAMRSLAILAIGLLFLAIFYFVLSLMIRLSFQRLRSALASLFAVVFVVLGTLYALPLIDAYRQGYDVSKSLLHPLVFASLGLAIVLLTQRNHHHL